MSVAHQRNEAAFEIPAHHVLHCALPLEPLERSRYGDEGGQRWPFIIAVVLVHAFLIGALLSIKYQRVERARPVTTMVTLLPDAGPPPPSKAVEPKLAQALPEILAPQPVVQTNPPPLPLAVTSQPVAPPPASTLAPAATPTTAPAPVAGPGAAVTAPSFSAKHLNNPPPRYPTESRRAREEGTVVLKVLVNPDGRPEDIQISKSSGYERLDKAALSAVRKWRFVPAEQAGTAVSAWVTFPIPFSLT